MNTVFPSMTRARQSVFFVIFMASCIWLCLFSTNVRASDDRINVIVSIAPQKYFVEQIGKDLVNVSVLLPPGASPHIFEPRPARMVEIGQADIYMAIGVEYENTLLPRIKSMHPGLTIARTDHGISRISMTPHSHDHGKHNHNDHHHHEGNDPHIWLSPELVMIQAGNIFKALAEASPQNRNYFHDNLISFQNKLKVLDQEIRDILASVPTGTKFMVFHPAWAYFARDYGLVQVAIEAEGKEPKGADLKHLIDTAGHENIRVIFVSPQFSRLSAQAVAESISGETVFIDPLAEDWAKNMRTVAEKFRQAYEHKSD